MELRHLDNDDLEREIERRIVNKRQVNWDGEFENGEYAVGEKTVRLLWL